MTYPLGMVNWYFMYMITTVYVFTIFDKPDKNSVHAVFEDLMNIPDDISQHLRGLFDINNFIYASAILNNFLRRV